MKTQLSPPPRNMLLINRLVIVFSGFFMQFGFAFLNMGLLFSFIFVGNSQIVHLLGPAYDAETQGTVVVVDATSFSANERPVREYIVEYEHEGQSYTVSGYSTSPPQVGERLQVSYQSENPETAEITEGQAAPFGYEVGFVLIFPLVGLGFVVFAFRRNVKSMDLMVNGRMAKGKFVQKTATNTQINKQTVYRYEFEFKGNDGRMYSAFANSHTGWELMDDEREYVLYAPSDPSYSVLLDNIPGAPPIAYDGSFDWIPLWRVVVLIQPAIALAIIYFGFSLYRIFL